MRIEFFRSILRQDIGYFDVHSSAEERFRTIISKMSGHRENEQCERIKIDGL